MLRTKDSSAFDDSHKKESNPIAKATLSIRGVTKRFSHRTGGKCQTHTISLRSLFLKNNNTDKVCVPSMHTGEWRDVC